MSCHICDNKIINIIAEAFIICDVRFESDDYISDSIWFNDITNIRNQIGQTLLTLNKAAYFSEYEEPTANNFVYEGVNIDMPVIYDAITEYENQVCNLYNYYESKIYLSFLRLKEAMLQRMINELRVRSSNKTQNDNYIRSK